MKTSITYYPNELKKSAKNGKTPIYMRICMRGKKSETRLNAELSQELLLKWDPITMRVTERSSPINQQLGRLDQKFQEFIILNATSLSNFDATPIKDYVLGNSSSQQNLVLKFVDDYFVDSVMQNVSQTPGTVKNCRRSITHLRNFLVFSKQEKLAFEQLTYEFAMARWNL